jgi:hypothetical protein
MMLCSPSLEIIHKGKVILNVLNHGLHSVITEYNLGIFGH